MPASKARIKANDKYNSKTYKQLAAKIKIADYDLIDEYCKTHDISKAKLLVNAVKYCINNNIDLLSTRD